MYLNKKKQMSKATEIIVESWLHGEISFIECLFVGYKRFSETQVKLRDGILQKYQNPELDKKTLKIIASNGLMKAIHNYNDKLSLDFNMFAARYIEDEIEGYLCSIL